MKNPSLRTAAGWRLLWFLPIIALAILGVIGIAVGARWRSVSAAGPASAAQKNGAPAASERVATFAGGCFWCVETPFENLDGVSAVISGYTGGPEVNPTYDAVSAGSTGHLESVEIHYDPARISYRELLDVFVRQIDPTDADGQFVDRGRQYRTAIFYHDDEQRQLAENAIAALKQSGRFDKPIVTQIVAAGPFYAAEDYHQDYAEKNPIRYKYYRYLSGRDQYLARVWKTDDSAAPAADTSGKKTEDPVTTKNEELKNRLTPLQYRVTQEEGTEPPFANQYWDNKEEGIYVDVVDGTPLFSSNDKYDSGTGWPSFTKPLDPKSIVEKSDRALLMVRTEVRSKNADSHLGHVFEDGPAPTGQRYCMNSAALRFIPKADLEKEGYGAYLSLFEKK